jgi:hypothetical protein
LKRLVATAATVMVVLVGVTPALAQQKVPVAMVDCDEMLF